MIRTPSILALTLTAALPVGLSTNPVRGTTISLIDPISGLDSGWQASFPGIADITLIVDAVTDDAVFIEKFVDFDQPPGVAGLLPGVTIDFTQTGSNSDTVPNIVILDEALTNLTGVDWNGFRMLVDDGGEAWFDVSRSSSFDVTPFSSRTFGGFLGGDPNRATNLFADDGTVSPLDTFFPGAGNGELWISVDVDREPITSFILKEVPVPEPTTIALLIGAAWTAGRRVRRRTTDR